MTGHWHGTDWLKWLEEVHSISTYKRDSSKRQPF